MGDFGKPEARRSSSPGLRARVGPAHATALTGRPGAGPAGASPLPCPDGGALRPVFELALTGSLSATVACPFQEAHGQLWRHGTKVATGPPAAAGRRQRLFKLFKLTTDQWPQGPSVCTPGHRQSYQVHDHWQLPPGLRLSRLTARPQGWRNSVTWRCAGAAHWGMRGSSESVWS